MACYTHCERYKNRDAITKKFFKAHGIVDLKLQGDYITVFITFTAGTIPHEITPILMIASRLRRDCVLSRVLIMGTNNSGRRDSVCSDNAKSYYDFFLPLIIIASGTVFSPGLMKLDY